MVMNNDGKLNIPLKVAKNGCYSVAMLVQIVILTATSYMRVYFPKDLNQNHLYLYFK